MPQLQNEPQVDVFNAVHQLLGAVQSATQWPPHRQPTKTKKALREIQRRHMSDVPRPPEEIDLKTLRRKVTKVLKAERSINELAPRDRRYSPWTLFFPEDKPDSWIATDPVLRVRYMDWLGSHAQSSRVSALLTAFFNAYPEDGETNKWWRSKLNMLLRHRSGPRMDRWRERVDRFDLLRSTGPDTMARSILDSDSVDDILEETGFNRVLQASLFLARVQSKLVAMATQHFHDEDSPDRFARVVDFVETEAGLRFPSLRHALASDLLRPFLNQNPGQEIKEKLCAFLLNHLKHPTANPGNWSRVEPDCRRLFQAWLVDSTLEEFFDLVEAAAPPQWYYRKYFWLAFHRRRLIDDAWIVLGTGAERAGGFLMRKHGYQFARFESGSSVESGHSALIFRIGGCVLTEWSHSGKCRLWMRGSNLAPKLGRPLYKANELRGKHCDYAWIHYGSEWTDSGWQEDVATWFREELGIDVPRTEYFPG